MHVNTRLRTRIVILSVQILLSLAASTALVGFYPTPELSSPQRALPIIELCYNLRYSYAYAGTTAVTAVFLFFLFFHLTIDRKILRRRYFVIELISLLFAVIFLMGKSFAVDNTLQSITASWGQRVKSVLFLLGFYDILSYSGYGLAYLLQRGAPASAGEGEAGTSIFDRRFSVVITALVIMALWLPHIVYAFPGYSNQDIEWQLSQYFGCFPINAHNPPMHTLFLGFIVNIGNRLFGANSCTFLYILVQYICFAFLLAYVLKVMASMGAPRWLMGSYILAIVFSPYYTSSVASIIKDNAYAYAFLLFIVEAICLIRRKDLSPIHYVLFWISAVLVIWFRNEGKLVAIPSLLVIYLLARDNLKQRWNKGHDRRQPFLNVRIALFFVTPVVFALGVNSAMINSYSMEKGSIREALSFPFQQTARFVLEHGEEVTEDERRAIDAILDYEHLAEYYNPRISDNVKNTFKKDSTTEDLMHYLRVWFKQGLRHPDTYVCATVNQTCFLFYPFEENNIAYSQPLSERGNSDDASRRYAKSVCEYLGIDYTEVSLRRASMHAWYMFCFSAPVIGVLSHHSIYCLCLLFASGLAIVRRQREWLAVSLPLLLSVAIILFAPTIMGHPRYSFPIIYTTPVMLAWLHEKLIVANAQRRKSKPVRRR